MSYSKIIDSLNEGASANVKLVESLLKGISNNDLSKVNKSCVDTKDLKVLFNKSKLGKNNKNKLIAKHINDVREDKKAECLIQIYSIGKEEYITFTFTYEGCLKNLGISYICHYDTDSYGSATTSLDFDAGEMYFSDIKDGVYGDVEGIALYNTLTDTYIGNDKEASKELFKAFSYNVATGVDLLFPVIKGYQDDFKKCGFSVELVDNFCLIVSINFYSYDNDINQEVFSELEVTKRTFNSGYDDSGSIYFFVYA